MRSKTFKAFTLLELLIGMILSGIVLAATFTAYRVVTHQYEMYRDKSRSVTEISFFVSRLELDFANASEITFIAENKIQLRVEKCLTEYRFTEKYALRTASNRTDTLYVSIIHSSGHYRSEKINAENSPLDELHVMMQFEGKSQEKTYLKTKDPKSEIDRETIELN